MFTITIQCNDVTELQKWSALLADAPSALVAETPAPAKTATKKPAAAKVEAVKEEPKAEAVKEEAKDEAHAEVAKAEGAIEYKTVSDAVLALIDKKGRPAALSLFAKWKVKNAKDLTPEQYGKFLAEVQAA